MGAEQSLIKKNNNGQGEEPGDDDISNVSSDSLRGMSSPIREDTSFNRERRFDKHKDVDSNGNKNSSSAEESNLMSRSTLVVVNTVPEIIEIPIESDPIFQRLNSIPNFLPIIDNLSKRFPWSSSKSNSQQLASKLQTHCVVRIGRLYNGFVRKRTTIVAKNQVILNKEVKQVDKEVETLMKLFITRQRKHAFYALKFEQIPEISKTMSKCQSTIADALKTADQLNNLLPEDEKLEKFEWCPVDNDNALNIDVREEKAVSVTRFP